MRSMRVKDMQMYGDGKVGWRERLMGQKKKEVNFRKRAGWD